MRHRIVRTIFAEISKATWIEKIVLIIPFIVLLIDAEIFYYAWTHKEITILIASGFVLCLSLLEIIAVVSEIHGHITSNRKREIIEVRIMKITKRMRKPTVRKIMDAFMDKYPNEYNMSEVYPIVCDLMSELSKD